VKQTVRGKQRENTVPKKEETKTAEKKIEIQ